MSLQLHFLYLGNYEWDGHWFVNHNMVCIDNHRFAHKTTSKICLGIKTLLFILSGSSRFSHYLNYYIAHLRSLYEHLNQNFPVMDQLCLSKLPGASMHLMHQLYHNYTDESCIKYLKNKITFPDASWLWQNASFMAGEKNL